MKTVLALTVVAAGIAFFGASTVDAETKIHCTSCGRIITGAYFETGGDFFHPQHFTCEYCKTPIKGQFSVYQGRNYHTECFENHVALRCSVCNGIIQGKYIIDHWGNKYHTSHKNELTRCDFCNRFITGSLAPGMVRYGDNRSLCGICSATAVTSLEDTKQIMAEAAGHLKRFGIVVDTREIEIHLIDLKELQRLSEKRAHSLRGFTGYEQKKNLLGQTRYKKIDMYLLNGMPRVEMMGIVAHELTHVWQFLQGPPTKNRALSEGSCNYAAYLVLTKIGGEEADFIIRNMTEDKDPIYGDGFRRVKRFVERNGITAWLDMLKTQDYSVSSF